MSAAAAAVADRVRGLMPQGRLTRAVAVLAGGHGMAQIIVAVSTPIITRLYAPDDFGIYGAATSLLLIVLALTCLLYDNAVTLPESDETSSDLVLLALAATLLTTALTGLVLLLGGEALLGLIGAEELWPYAWLLLVAQLGGGLFMAFNALGVRRADFGVMATARVSQSVVMVGTQLGAGLAGAGPAGLIGGDAAGRVASGARLAARGVRALGSAFASASPRRLLGVAVRYRRFPLLGVGPMLLQTFAIYAPVLFMVGLYGPAAGGLFAFGQRLIGAPLALLTLSVGDVYMSEAARVSHGGVRRLRPLYRNTLRKLARTAAPVVLLAVPASFLVGPVFGAEWVEAGYYIAILMPMYLAQVLASPFGGTLMVLERQDLWLVREVVRVSLVSAAIVLASALSLSAIWAVVLVSAAGTLSYTAYGLLSYYAIAAAERREAAAAA